MEGESRACPPSDVGDRVALFRFDPGWPFLIAGLALIVSAVLIPAQRELHELEQELLVHRAHEERANAELHAYHQFLADISRGDERLLERLVRAQLNQMPRDERPLLLMPTANDTVPQWIESSVSLEIPEVVAYPDTLLSRIATGPRRLWVLASGTFLVFLGVMFAPGPARPGRRSVVAAEAPEGGVDGAAIGTALATMEPEVADSSLAGAADGEWWAQAHAEQHALDKSMGLVSMDRLSIAADADTDAEGRDAGDGPSASAVIELVAEAEAVSHPAELPDPETADSVTGEVTTFEAVDVYDLQYGADDSAPAILLGGTAALRDSSELECAGIELASAELTAESECARENEQAFMVGSEAIDATVTAAGSSIDDPVIDAREAGVDAGLAEIAEDEIAEDEIVEDEIVEDEIVEDEIVEDEIAEDEVVEDEVVEDEVVEDEIVEDEVVEDEVVEDEVVEDEVVEDEVVEDEVVEDEVVEDEVVELVIELDAEGRTSDDESVASAVLDSQQADTEPVDTVPSDEGVEIARAETVALAEHPRVTGASEAAEPPLACVEIETYPAAGMPSTDRNLPSELDRRLDRVSLFEGIDEGRWIGTTPR